MSEHISKCGRCRKPVRIDYQRFGTYHCDACALTFRTVVDGQDVPDAQDADGVLRLDIAIAWAAA